MNDAGDGGHRVDPQRQAALVGGKASVRIAAELAIRSAPPTPWPTRIAISHMRGVGARAST